MAMGSAALAPSTYQAQQRETLRAYFDDLLYVLRVQGAGPLAPAALRVGGLLPDDVIKGSARLSFDAYYRILDWLYRAQVIPVPGLQLGLRRRLTDSGVFGCAIQSMSRFSQALRLAERYFPAAWGYARLQVSIEASQVVSRYLLLPSVVIGHVPLLQAVSSASLAACRELLPDEDLSACEVRYHFAPPADAAAYRQRLGCRVRFAQPYDEFRHPVAWLDRQPTAPQRADGGLDPLPAHAHRLWRTAADSAGWAGRVRHVLQHHAAEGIPGLDEVAAALAVAPRTLRHRLAAEGVSFRCLLQELRMNLARRYLDETSLSVADIADLLGYAQPASFYRLYRARFGDSPRGTPRC